MRALGFVLLILVLVIGWAAVRGQGDGAGSTGERGGDHSDDDTVREEQGQQQALGAAGAG